MMDDVEKYYCLQAADEEVKWATLNRETILKRLWPVGSTIKFRPNNGHLYEETVIRHSDFGGLWVTDTKTGGERKIKHSDILWAAP